MNAPRSRASAHANACLLLVDGKEFFGTAIGAENTIFGEICFNTGMTGYQEVLTDPSYAGQIITFTFPHIGNTGANDEDIESVHAEAGRLGASGLVLREDITAPSNFRHTGHFNNWLRTHNISGIAGVDTRALTRYIREHGAQNAAIISSQQPVTDDQLERARKQLSNHPSLKGMELARSVSTAASYLWDEMRWKLGHGYIKQENAKYHVVAVDYGEKRNILRCLADKSCRITVVSAHTPANEILALKPDGIFLSNGPGDPAATGEYALPILRELIESGIPIFGICLGHQLLALALGAKTDKMHQGHRGSNHPVKNLLTNAVEITSQNHGFHVLPESLPEGVMVTHTSLFDGCIEGIRLVDKPVFSVQYHPESSPGPHDSHYLFDEFIGMMAEHTN